MEPGTSDTFLEKLRREIDNNLTNEQFSVEVLAGNVGMSRSKLHRKISEATGRSVSQFIREYRLQLGMALLQEGDLTAAEVADKVGFGSATYFSTCFAEYYGFPPGEARNRSSSLVSPAEPRESHVSGLRMGYLVLALAIFLVIVVVIFYTFAPGGGEQFNGGDPGLRQRSIAILPFRNLSDEPQDAYLSEGIVEAIRSDLSKIRSLRVISRTSVEQYREGSKSAHVISEELGVGSLLEGSVQRYKDRIRIDVRLIDGVSEGHLWSSVFDRELEDVFSIQNEIAQQVAIGLKASLSPEEKIRMSNPDTENPKAYDLYLRGLYEYRTYTNTGAHNAINLLSDAIALDSGYAKAYAFLANSYIGLATIWGAELNALEALEKGKPYIDRALAIDPELEEANMLLGFYRLYHDWDFKGAEEAYQKGIVSDHPDGLAMYIDYLNFMSRHEEAMALTERLNANEPYYPNSRMMFSCFYSGRITEALRYSEARLKIFNNYNTYDGHGFLLLNTGRYDEAIGFFRKALALEGIRYPRILSWMGAAYARSGKHTVAREIAAELEARLKNKEGGSIAFFLAVIYTALGDKPVALAWLQKAYSSHDMEMPWLMTEPQLYPLHDAPEFQKIAAAMGFS